MPTITPNPNIQMQGNQKLLTLPNKKVYFYGSTEPSANGIEMTKNLVNLALKKDWTIVTNFQSGINQISEIESLKQNHPVISVNPLNLDETYPMNNDYLKSLTYIKNGLVISTNPTHYIRDSEIKAQNTYIEKLVNLIIFIETPINEQVDNLLQMAEYRKTKTAFVPTNNQKLNQGFLKYKCRKI